MKRFSIVLVLLTSSACSLFSQMISPLQQVMSSNSLINRPDVFRDLQASIETVVGNTQPGAQLPILYEKLSMLRGEILGMVKVPTIGVPGWPRRIIQMIVNKHIVER